MGIIATARVPSNGNLATIRTIELPKIRTSPTSHRKPEPAIATPCPPWCDQHSTGTPGCSGDRTTVHEAPRAIVNTTFSSGPNEHTSTHNEVQVWVERFDLDEEQDGHPVVGYPVPHLMLDQTHDVGMTADQAERIGRALLDSAAKVRAYDAGTTRPAGSPVWPPAACPSWCPDVDNPAEHLSDLGADHYEDRSHIHDHYQCTGESASDCEPGEIPLTLEKLWAYETGTPDKRVTRFTHQTLVAQLSQHYLEAEPRIGLGHHTGDLPAVWHGVDLTLAEAEHLVQLLTHLVELGRQG